MKLKNKIEYWKRAIFYGLYINPCLAFEFYRLGLKQTFLNQLNSSYTLRDFSWDNKTKWVSLQDEFIEIFWCPTVEKYVIVDYLGERYNPYFANSLEEAKYMAIKIEKMYPF